MSISKLLKLLILLIPLLAIGVFGYMRIEGWSFIDALYMTIITLSTVGFQEVHQLSDAGRIFTLLYIILGVGNMAFILSNIVQFAMDMKLDQLYRRRHMKQRIKKLKDHTIICGYGQMGKKIATELDLKNEQFVIIDNDPAKAEELTEKGYMFFCGSASNDEILISAGIEKAKSLVTVVNTDSENVFITLTAKSLNKDINIISRVTHESTQPKLLKAGANKIISPYNQASVKIAQSILNPAVDDFLEIITNDRAIEFQMADIAILDNNKLINKTLEESDFKEKGMIIVGIWKDSGKIVYAPNKDEVIESGDRLIAIGSGQAFSDQIKNMKSF